MDALTAFWNQVARPDNIPVLILLCAVASYSFLAVGKGRLNDRQGFPSEGRLADKIQVWPHLVRVEFLAAIGVLLILMVWSVFVDAPLEGPANPAVTPNPTKAPWYFVGLQELLVYFDPWIAGFTIPTVIMIGLMLIPYIDRNADGNGFYTIRRRRRAIAVFAAGFIGLWITLILIGTFWRGPGWNFVPPWVEWDPHRMNMPPNADLTEVVFGIRTWRAGHRLNPAAFVAGAVCVALYFIVPLFMFIRTRRRAAGRTHLLTAVLTWLLLLLMLAVPLKMFLRIVFGIKYVWVTPWFNV